jgi:hypothetical protein
MLRGISVAALLTLASPIARAEPVEDALRCLEEQARLEAQRATLLHAADSLGLRSEEAGRGGRRVDPALLRKAERLQREALDLEVTYLARREDCRRAVARALPACDERLRGLERVLAQGRADPVAARDLLDWREVRSRLQSGIEEPAVVGYPLLPPDSSDTQESLRAKLQYHEEVHGHLRDLAARIDARSNQLREERRTLEDARRFLDELGFLDEGGRIAAGRSDELGGTPGNPNPPTDALGRLAGRRDGADRGIDLESVLGWTPATPEESDRFLRFLDAHRREIGQEIQAVERMTGRIRERILPEPGAPR